MFYLKKPLKMWSHAVFTLLTDTVYGSSSITGHWRNVKAIQYELEYLVESVWVFVYPFRELGYESKSDATYGIVGVGGDRE